MMSFMTYYSVGQRKWDQVGAKYIRIGRTDRYAGIQFQT